MNGTANTPVEDWVRVNDRVESPSGLHRAVTSLVAYSEAGESEDRTGSTASGRWGTIADRLSAEFKAPVGILDEESAIWWTRRGAGPDEFPDATETARKLRAERLTEPTILRLDLLKGPTWLVLPLPQIARVESAAFVGFGPGPEPTTWGPICFERALTAWGHRVLERLDPPSTPQSRGAVDLSGREPTRLTPADRLIRRLRVSDSPERFQRMAIAAAREDLRVAAVAWVPGHPRESVVVAGEVAGLNHDAYRTLLPDSSSETLRVVNGAGKDAPAQRFAVVAAPGEPVPGWLIAVNTLDERPFATLELEILQPVAGLIAAQRSNARLYADLKDLVFGVIRSLTAAIDAKDPYTSGHSERVARIAVRLGEQLGLDPIICGDLYLMGLLHDVGKIGIEDEVLKKRGALTGDEFRKIQSHVRIGVHILSDLKKLRHLLPGVAHHHESLDGSGYPDGLAGEDIPLAARVLAVADAFDAMSCSRPYRSRLSPLQIDVILRKGSGTQWDPRVVEALFDCRGDLERIRQKGLGESLQRAVDDTLGRS